MKALSPETFFFCLGTGAAMGCLFLLFQGARLLLGAGRLGTALLDVLFCCVCSAGVFLCALAVDHGRLRLAQALLQAAGAWAAVVFLGPPARRLAVGAKKFFRRVFGFFHRAGAFLAPHFHRRRPGLVKKQEKTRQKRKKAEKKT